MTGEIVFLAGNVQNTVLPPAVKFTAASEDIYHHAEVLDKKMQIESAVLAGPVTFTETITVTGTLVIL